MMVFLASNSTKQNEGSTCYTAATTDSFTNSTTVKMTEVSFKAIFYSRLIWLSNDAAA